MTLHHAVLIYGLGCLTILVMLTGWAVDVLRGIRAELRAARPEPMIINNGLPVQLPGRCLTCGGTGYLFSVPADGLVSVSCPSCKGSGRA